MKHESRPYSTDLEGKLEQLPGVDADHLWDDMHSILDKKMPERREKRRFIVWFLSDRGLFSVGIALLLAGTGFCLFFFSPNRTSSTDISTTKLPVSAQQNKPNEKAVNSETGKETVTINSTHITENKIAEPSAYTGTDKITDNYIPQQTKTWRNFTTINTTNNNNTAANAESKQLDNIVGANEISRQSNRESDPLIIEPADQHDSYITSDDFNPISHDITSDVINNEQEQNSLQQQSATQTNAAKQDIQVQKEKGLYAGIVAGMDLSSVQFQSLGTGASQGLIVGYAFNTRWSVESGVLWDKKRYYDDGSNFNPPGYTPTPSVQIISVYGTNKNYEWPINVRYTIIPRKNSLFATAGVSSYFMKSEHFEYEYVQNSQPGGHNYITYNNATKNWFSVVNFSVGYAHKLGSVGSLRIEPYFKIPIKNLGTANMPIMSTGLNIGFTRSLSR